MEEGLLRLEKTLHEMFWSRYQTLAGMFAHSIFEEVKDLPPDQLKAAINKCAAGLFENAKTPPHQELMRFLVLSEEFASSMVVGFYKAHNGPFPHLRDLAERRYFYIMDRMVREEVWSKLGQQASKY